MPNFSSYHEWLLLVEHAKATERHYLASICSKRHSPAASTTTVYRYYQLAVNRYQLNRLKWVMERSLVGTLAHNLRISVSKVYKRYETSAATTDGPRKVLQVTVEREGGKKPLVAQWGGISLARKTKAVLTDQIAPMWGDRSELEKRLLADTCELCGSREHVQVHHIRALKDLQRKG
jgi:hypothetical protein